MWISWQHSCFSSFATASRLRLNIAACTLIMCAYCFIYTRCLNANDQLHICSGVTPCLSHIWNPSENKELKSCQSLDHHLSTLCQDLPTTPCLSNRCYVWAFLYVLLLSKDVLPNSTVCMFSSLENRVLPGYVGRFRVTTCSFYGHL